MYGSWPWLLICSDGSNFGYAPVNDEDMSPFSKLGPLDLNFLSPSSISSKTGHINHDVYRIPFSFDLRHTYRLSRIKLDDSRH